MTDTPAAPDDLVARAAPDDLVARAAQAGVDSFMATFGRFPERFALLHEHAPGAFAGYGLMRDFVMQEKPKGALDMRTKELLFAALDTLHGDKYGAINHGLAAMKLGLTVPEMAEAIVQVIMVGGITTWNLVGAELLATCVDHANGVAPKTTL